MQILHLYITLFKIIQKCLILIFFKYVLMFIENEFHLCRLNTNAPNCPY